MKNQIGPLSKDLISAAVLLLLGIWIWFYSGQFPNLPEGHPGPKLFPRIIAIGLAVIGLSLGIMELRSKKANPTTDAEEIQVLSDKSHLRLSLGIILIGIFPIVSPLIGFVPSLLIIGSLIGLSLQVRWWKTIVTAAVTVGVIYLIFSGLLNVPL